MARNPVLVELLIAAIEETGADVLTNQAQVYLSATNKLMLRNIATDRTFTSTADKLCFLCELASQMISSGELQIHYKDIPDAIRRYFHGKSLDDHELDHWEYDLRNQTLLRPNLSGYYEFSHKSLAEFFVAFKFGAELGCLSRTFRETYQEAEGKPCNLPYGKKGVPELAESVGLIPIGDVSLNASREFLGQMISGEELESMRELLLETRETIVKRGWCWKDERNRWWCVVVATPGGEEVAWVNTLSRAYA